MTEASRRLDSDHPESARGPIALAMALAAVPQANGAAVQALARALHEFYGEGPNDTCWHDHDAEVIAALLAQEDRA
jgi:hypothetical protein